MNEAGDGESARKLRSMATELANAPEWNWRLGPRVRDEEDDVADDSQLVVHVARKQFLINDNLERVMALGRASVTGCA